MKKCCHCQEEKDKSEFYKYKGELRARCKKCYKLYPQTTKESVEFKRQNEILPEKKICNICNTEKLLEQFYKEWKGKYGRQSWCIECDKIRMKKIRKLPSIIEKRKIATARLRKISEKFKATRIRASKRYREKYPQKYNAQKLVATRIRRGKLIRPNNCEKCGIECKPEAHHNDYSKPLEVEWLCKQCHDVYTHKKGLKDNG